MEEALVSAVVRAADVRDASAIAAVYEPWVTSSVVSFEESAPSADEVGRRMLLAPRLPWLVASRGGEVVGFAYGSHHRARPAYRWSVDCSVYLAGAERGRGTGRALYAALLPLLRELGYVTAYAGIALPNDASVGLHESLGFAPVGVFRQVGFKLGAWHDVGWWSLALLSAPSLPAEPVTWEPG